MADLDRTQVVAVIERRTALYGFPAEDLADAICALAAAPEPAPPAVASSSAQLPGQLDLPLEPQP